MIKREEDLWTIYAVAIITIVLSITFLLIMYDKYTLNTKDYGVVVKEVVGEPNRVGIQEYRLTHYYTGDPMGSGKCTASGLCTNKFQTNSKGWYTYKGKLVMASGYEYQLWDVVEIQIDNVWYEALILDKCGACRKAKKIDLFVNGKANGIDRKVVFVK